MVVVVAEVVAVVCLEGTEKLLEKRLKLLEDLIKVCILLRKYSTIIKLENYLEVSGFRHEVF